MRKGILYLLIIFGVTACLEELEDIDKAGIGTLNPDIAVPLVNTTFTLEDFLEEGKSVADVSVENNVLVISYGDTISTPTFTNIALNDQSSPDFTISGSQMMLTPPGSSANFTFSDSLTFNTSGGDQLDSIILKAGILLPNVEINAPTSGSITFTFNSIKRNGQPLTQSLSWTFDGTNPVPSQLGDPMDLTDAVIELTNNKVAFGVDVDITIEGTVQNTDEIRFNFGISGLDYRGIFGIIGTRPISTPSRSLSIDIFDNIESGAFKLEDPRIGLIFRNSFGFEVNFGLDQVAAFRGAQSVGFTSTPNNLLINTPTNPRDFAETTIDFDTVTSNIDDLLNILPTTLSYTFPGDVNPNGLNGFVLDDSSIDIIINIDLPLSGSIGGITLSKLFTFEATGIDELNNATIIVNTINSFPLDGNLQVYFLDDNMNRLDSLYTDQDLFFAAAQVDGNGFSVAPTEISDRIEADAAKIDRIEQSTNILLRATLRTNNNGTVPIKISPSNDLTINIGVETELELN